MGQKVNPIGFRLESIGLGTPAGTPARNTARFCMKT